MNDPTSKPGQPKDAEIAAAEWLLEEAPAPVATRPAGPVLVPSTEESFDLAEPDSVAASPVPRFEEPAEQAAPRRSRGRMAMPQAPAVEQVWTRTAEWGPSLLILGAWVVGTLWLLYLCLGAESYSLAAIVFVAGCLGGMLLCYPILITLERPVRITPEQAARDFFGSLSHHRPHHRRMWLLLSARGKTSADFATFEGFRRYWRKRLAQLRDGHAAAFAPLVFQVEDFRAEKSAGRTDIEAKFQLRIFVRGRRDQGPIWSFPLERTFARGPDGMWYLDDGTLSLGRSPDGQPRAS
ncbi:MAG: hypothetical protein U0790_09290 [Isosphaeraceae bacterium]